jgi:hypothetical protein
MSETSSVVRPLLHVLELLHISAHRIHSGKVKVRGGWLHLGPEGQPDIGGHLPSGRAFYVEGKASHGDACNCKSCTAQRKFRKQAEADNALYVFARSVAEALQGLGLDAGSAR